MVSLAFAGQDVEVNVTDGTKKMARAAERGPSRGKQQEKTGRSVGGSNLATVSALLIHHQFRLQARTFYRQLIDMAGLEIDFAADKAINRRWATHALARGSGASML